MNLVKLNSTMPLRAIPEETLNKVILMDLLPFLTGLLSLTDEVSANRLEIALPAIKERCIGMGFAEIKKMFEMYVDSKLNLKPIPNYFDRILLGKIVDSYKSLNIKKIKPIESKQMTPEEIEFQMIEAVDRVKKEYKQLGRIDSLCHHVYDYLFKQGVLPKEKEYKDKIFARAKSIARGNAASKATQSLEEHRGLKKALEDIELKGNTSVIIIAKRLVLEDYLKSKQDEI